MWKLVAVLQAGAVRRPSTLFKPHLYVPKTSGPTLLPPFPPKTRKSKHPNPPPSTLPIPVAFSPAPKSTPADPPLENEARASASLDAHPSTAPAASNCVRTPRLFSQLHTGCATYCNKPHAHVRNPDQPQ
ncbi:uncharacterized protein BDZ99DRAFT_464293 [Mytilinidion resinicola]|uniref:Uncharacterized protein n=1 Tax=Mytilinidion resinicola TaxID=574789 RepID=A0A6A6YI03_9PEZI|nr:uncharacterized protein BDZ99DRAFT_464293 [Mytilinidion resinicola]KAF2808410.1 hypothetical protein BDZ99DRAFT_464293 [Mytilinidion resinicola]